MNSLYLHEKRDEPIHMPLFALWVGVGIGFILIMYLVWPHLLPFLFFLIPVIVLSVKPEYLFFLALLVFPIQSFFFQWFGDFQKNIFLVDIVMLCAFCSWCLAYLTGRRRAYPGTCIDWFLAIFFSWALVTFFWTPDIDQGIFQIVRLIICYAAFFLAIVVISNRRVLDNVWRVYILMGVLEALICIVSIYSDYGLIEEYTILQDLEMQVYFWGKHIIEETGRAEGTGVSHSMAVYLVTPVFFCVGYFLTATTLRKKLVWLLAGSVITGGVLSTLTKSAIGSLWIGLGFMIFQLRPLRKWLVTSLVILLLASVAIFVVVRSTDIEKSLMYHSKQIDTKAKGTSMEIRLGWWKEGIKKLVDTYGLGYGVGGYVRKVGLPVPDGAHPAVLFDFGLIGSMIWSLLFANSFLYFYRALKRFGGGAKNPLLLSYMGGYVAIIISWIVTLNYDFVDLFLYLGIGYAEVLILERQHRGVVVEA